MKNDPEGQCESIKKALKKLGFKVEKIRKEGKKTIITVFQSDTGKKIVVPYKKQSVNSNN